MPVACPQCGAPAAAQTESRYYRCSYCTSAFIIQEERGVERFTISHRRDDRLAWSALADYLERNRTEPSIGKGQVEFTFVPYWCFTLDNGTTRMVPAVSPPLPEASVVTIPGGDLRFPLPEEEFAPPDVPLAEAERALNGTVVTKRTLLHLPLYLLTYTSDGAPFHAVISGADRKVYARSLPEGRGLVIPRHHFLIVGLYAVLLVIEALAIRRPEWRALAFLLTLGAAWLLLAPILGREC